MSLVHAEMIYKNTGCLFLPSICIPFYRITEEEWILLDCGSHFEREHLMEYLREKRIRVRAVICSHAHFDHIENSRQLQETYGAQLVMTALDAGLVHDGLSLKACFYSHTVQDNEAVRPDMICSPDRILMPDERQVQICGVSFEMLPLPGHAASHMGILTPDGVLYLADSVFSVRELEQEKLFYMLDWTRALETMKRIEGFHYKRYILAHQGVCEEIGELAQENQRRLTGVLEELLALCDGEYTLEELARRLAQAKNSHVGSVEKARFMERLTRSMTEYWLERGALQIQLRDGIMVYTRNFSAR